MKIRSFESLKKQKRPLEGVSRQRWGKPPVESNLIYTRARVVCQHTTGKTRDRRNHGSRRESEATHGDFLSQYGAARGRGTYGAKRRDTVGAPHRRRGPPGLPCCQTHESTRRRRTANASIEATVAMAEGSDSSAFHGVG